jgi:hypothetical protein
MLSREENCVSIISETKGFKNLNYKIVNLDKNCNFRINFISIQVHYLRATFFFWRGGITSTHGFKNRYSSGFQNVAKPVRFTKVLERFTK